MSQEQRGPGKSLGSPMGPARRRVLSDEVLDTLRNAILTGELEPGSRLPEDELALKLDVSRGPIREALVRLQQEGLVTLERHRSAHVRTMSAVDAEQIYGLRQALERLAVEWACRNGADEDFARMEAVLDDFNRLAKSKRTPARVAELDIRFHDEMFASARNDRLYHAWEGLRSQIFAFLLTRMALRQDYNVSWEPDHRDLLELLRAGRMEEATVFVSRHVESAYDRVKSAIDETSMTSA
jgi:DNA-binding GntR family transcriptional regulator